MINEMHKIAACIAWHTLNDRFIIVALVQISIVKSYVSMGVIFLIWGFVNLKQLSHADTFNLVSISYLKNVCRSLTDPKIQFIKWNFESLNQIYALSCCGKNEFFCCCNSSVLLSCSLLVLPVMKVVIYMFCSLFDLWSAGL